MKLAQRPEVYTEISQPLADVKYGNSMMKKKNQFKASLNTGSRALLSTAVLEPSGSTILLKSPTLKRRDRDDCCHVVGKGTPTASHKNSPLSGGG